MKSPCHLLIASSCIADLLHDIGQYPFIYQYFTSTLMPQSSCLYVQVIPMIGDGFGTLLILNLGIDRLIAIMLPLR
ncbi:hypothetical protein Aduo_016261 [Ancylostoma duodenale]